MVGQISFDVLASWFVKGQPAQCRLGGRSYDVVGIVEIVASSEPCSGGTAKACRVDKHHRASEHSALSVRYKARLLSVSNKAGTTW